MRLQYHHDVTKSVAFRFSASQAQHVSLVIRSAKGDKTSAPAMHKGVDGVWHVKVELTRGRHTYRFLVDNAPTLDSASRGNVPDDHGAMWSTREVGH
jgi:1,4-alpha-glucan branching enzyme